MDVKLNAIKNRLVRMAENTFCKSVFMKIIDDMPDQEVGSSPLVC